MHKGSGRLAMWTIASLIAAAHGHAQTPVSQTLGAAVPPQPVASALQVWAWQTGWQLLYDPGLAVDQQSRGAGEGLQPIEALTRILDGTGLAYRFVNERTVSILPLNGETSGSRVYAASMLARTGEEIDEPASRVVDASTEMSASGKDGSDDDDRKAPRSTRMDEVVEVIVTAQKREEKLIDVPQSVSVLSADTIAKLGVVQFRDFANMIPGLAFTTAGAGFTQISLRGVTAGLDVSSTTAIYVDEVPYGSGTSFTASALLTLDAGLFDLDRVEVLRGPQGTLYGASSMGGLLKYVGKRPDAVNFGADVQTGISGTQDGGVSYNVAGAVNAPIVTDKVALRASGFESRDGGYIDNLALGQKDVNRSDVYGGRLDLLFTPTEALGIRITGFSQNISRDGDASADYSFSGTPVDGGLEQRRPSAEPFDQRFRLISGTVNYDLVWASLTSISSYQTIRSDLARDFSPLYVPLLTLFGRSYSAVAAAQTLNTEKFTQELRLASHETESLEWLLGGFYTDDTADSATEFLVRDLAGELAPNDLFSLSIPSHYREHAAFGNLTYHLTRKFDVSGGVRYSRNRQRFEQSGSGLLARSTPPRESSEDVFTYLANARYQFSDHATAYIRYATGYRPGGPNLVLNDPTTGFPVGPSTFEADRLKSYEAGIKAETADRRFGIDLAGYYIEWNNIQVSAQRSGLSFVVNASGGATIRGAELTLSARPARGFIVTGAFGYQDAKMSKADLDFGAAKDERLPNVPRFTAALSADYAFAEESLRPTIGASVRHVSDRMASFDNSSSYPQYHLPDYATADLRTGVTFGSVSAQLYVHNLFDERGQLSTLAAVGGPRTAISQPRTIGISATTHF